MLVNIELSMILIFEFVWKIDMVSVCFGLGYRLVISDIVIGNSVVLLILIIICVVVSE